MLEGVEMDTTDMPDLESEKSAAERNITKKVKLKRQRFDEIAKKEKKISAELFERYFGYSSPSYYKVLVNIIENRLAK